MSKPKKTTFAKELAKALANPLSREEMAQLPAVQTRLPMYIKALEAEHK